VLTAIRTCSSSASSAIHWRSARAALTAAPVVFVRHGRARPQDCAHRDDLPLLMADV
jgi:hypothetical protein